MNDAARAKFYKEWCERWCEQAQTLMMALRRTNELDRRLHEWDPLDDDERDTAVMETEQLLDLFDEAEVDHGV